MKRSNFRGKARFLSRCRRVKKNAALDHWRQMYRRPIEKQQQGRKKKIQVHFRLEYRLETWFFHIRDEPRKTVYWTKQNTVPWVQQRKLPKETHNNYKTKRIMGKYQQYSYSPSVPLYNNISFRTEMRMRRKEKKNGDKRMQA